MSSETYENEKLAERIEKLQKGLRWTTGIGIAAIALLLGLMVLHRTTRYHKMTAQEFVLTDSLGRERAKLALFPEGAGLQIYAASGEPRVQLTGGGEESTLNLHIPVTARNGLAAVNFLQDNAQMATFRANPATALLDMHPAADRGAARLSLQHGVASLMLNGVGDGSPKVSLETDATHACAALGGPAHAPASGSLCLYSPGLPTLELADLAGNRAVLGIKQTAYSSASEPHVNSAASLALEHKSGKSMHLEPQ